MYFFFFSCSTAGASDLLGRLSHIKRVEFLVGRRLKKKGYIKSKVPPMVKISLSYIKSKKKKRQSTKN